jgi:hypothetical protein
MTSIVAIGMPGPMEWLIIGATVAIPIALIVFLVWLVRRRP